MNFGNNDWLRSTLGACARWSHSAWLPARYTDTGAHPAFVALPASRPGRTLLSKGPLSVLPGSKPATGGGVLLVGTRRLELSKDNFVLRCLTTQGRYVISMNEVRRRPLTHCGCVPLLWPADPPDHPPPPPEIHAGTPAVLNEIREYTLLRQSA